MARKLPGWGSKHDPASNGHGTYDPASTARTTFPVGTPQRRTPQPRPGRTLKVGEEALLRRLGERPRPARNDGTRGRVVSARQRWF